MSAIRQRLTYANVVSTIALFLVLCGGAAYAAKVAKKSVGPAQLKASAVTTSKIKANAVTTRKIKRNAVSNAKIKENAVTAEKIASGSVTKDKVNVESMPFARVTNRLRGSLSLALSGVPLRYPLSPPAYIQPSGRDDSYIGAVDIIFEPGCEAPRAVNAYVQVDAPDPNVLSIADVVASGLFVDSGTGVVKQRIELSPVAEGSTRFSPTVDKAHTISLIVEDECKSGSGVRVNFGGVDVIGVE